MHGTRSIEVAATQGEFRAAAMAAIAVARHNDRLPKGSRCTDPLWETSEHITSELERSGGDLTQGPCQGYVITITLDPIMLRVVIASVRVVLKLGHCDRTTKARLCKWLVLWEDWKRRLNDQEFERHSHRNGDDQLALN